MFRVFSDRKDGYAASLHRTQVLGVGTLLPGPVDLNKVTWSRTDEADGAICELTYFLFDHIHQCISNNALYTQGSNWAELNSYRECVGLLPIVFVTLPYTIVHPLNISRPHRLTRP